MHPGMFAAIAGSSLLIASSAIPLPPASSENCYLEVMRHQYRCFQKEWNSFSSYLSIYSAQQILKLLWSPFVICKPILEFHPEEMLDEAPM